MRGDQLSCQRRVIRAIEASPNGLTVSEVAKREEPGIRAIYLHLEELQAVPFHLNTPAYLDQIQSGMEIHLRKVAQLRIWLNGGILYIIGLCPLTEEVRMFVLDRIKMLKVIGEQFDFLRNFNLEFIRDLWETFVRSVNNWFAISQSNFSTNVPPSDKP